jgi:hypothetical protein
MQIFILIYLVEAAFLSNQAIIQSSMKLFVTSARPIRFPEPKFVQENVGKMC